jgi:hypothetical protein
LSGCRVTNGWYARWSGRCFSIDPLGIDVEIY